MCPTSVSGREDNYPRLRGELKPAIRQEDHEIVFTCVGISHEGAKKERLANVFPASRSRVIGSRSREQRVKRDEEQSPYLFIAWAGKDEANGQNSWQAISGIKMLAKRGSTEADELRSETRGSSLARRL